MTDNEFVLGLIHNNKNAFNELINNYTVLLLKIIKGILNKSHEGDFIEQCFDDTIIKIWKKIDSYKGDSEFKYWIFTIARNTALDYKRKLNKYYEEEELKESHIKTKSAEEEYFIIEDNNLENKIINKLNDNDKRLFLDKFIFGLSTEEICKKYFLSENIIYKRISRLKKKCIKIKNNMEKEEDVYE